MNIPFHQEDLFTPQTHRTMICPAILMATVLVFSHLSTSCAEVQDKKEPANSLQYYQELAEKGDVEAQAELGLIYLEGRGVSQNYEEALKWFRKAANHGHAGAQFRLGIMYAKGLGTSKNYDQAINWFRQAASQGYEPAKRILEALGKKM
jgi:TPR repeat protein